ncbi:hypothetical protein QE152_g35005 [Popillia japonica]|uniref:Uncharacterized protein n=1 Tax=Popillia japonica TaxID=7064 RepID=A0AAW1ISU7_POPJA
MLVNTYPKEQHLAVTMPGLSLFVGRSADDNCIYCSKRDTVEHTLLDYERWQAERSQLNSQVGKEMQSGTNMINLMVEYSGIWEEVHRYIRDVMSKKEKETRQRY